MQLLIRHHAALPSFSARLAAAGLTAEDVATAEGLRALPLLSRRALQDEYDAQPPSALPAEHAPAILSQTSGSTGEPVRVHRTAVNQLLWLALTLRYHLWHEPDFAGRLCAIRALAGPAREGRSWGAPFDQLFATGPSLLLDNNLDVEAQVEQLRRFRPDSLILYPTNLQALLDREVELPGLRRVRTIGEMLPPETRTQAEAGWGVPVRDCYSSKEFGYLAIECPAGGLYHLMAESLLVELLDEHDRPCASGQIGRLVVTDLHNFATPMIRYEIGDHAEAGPACPCGRGLPTLRRILGRTRNMVRRPDGTTSWPITGFKRFRDIAPIRQYQIVQQSLEAVELRLVADRPLEGGEEAALAERLRDYLGWPFDIRLRYFEGRLPNGPNGKFEEFKSLIGQ